MIHSNHLFKRYCFTFIEVLSYSSYSIRARDLLLEKLRRNTSSDRYTKTRGHPGNIKIEYEPTQEFHDSFYIRALSSRLQNILSNDILVVCRQYEMLNIFFGYEQHNRYVIHDRHGQPVGYIVEESGGIMKWFARQLLKTHRPLKAWILDLSGEPLLAFYRPWRLINSRLSIIHSSDDGSIVGEVHQEWHLFRRRYDLFIGKRQFARIDAPFLSWEFNLLNQNDKELCIISRNFTHFVREVFTDTGQYAISFGKSNESEHLMFCKRAIMLGCAVSIDVDYFSRHSNHIIV